MRRVLVLFLHEIINKDYKNGDIKEFFYIGDLYYLYSLWVQPSGADTGGPISDNLYSIIFTLFYSNKSYSYNACHILWPLVGIEIEIGAEIIH